MLLLPGALVLLAGLENWTKGLNSSLNASPACCP